MSQDVSKLTVVVAGSTANTLTCARSLQNDPRFIITCILTPSPKPAGRKKEIKENPLHQFGITHSLPVILIEKRIDDHVKSTLLNTCKRPDILLVVDFGYIVPSWLLEWPTIAPVNIHPSDLPKYRGSSPGQFALLFGENESAVSIMRMDEKLDHGPIIEKIRFPIIPSWTASDYYQHAFSLTAKELSTILYEFSSSTKQTQAQPDDSPTPIARMLTRDDGYVPSASLTSLLGSVEVSQPIPLLEAYGIQTTPLHFYRMWQGCTPWPGIWTTIKQGEKETRVKILELTFEDNVVTLHTIQYEGKNPQKFTGF